MASTDSHPKAVPNAAKAFTVIDGFQDVDSEVVILTAATSMKFDDLLTIPLTKDVALVEMQVISGVEVHYNPVGVAVAATHAKLPLIRTFFGGYDKLTAMEFICTAGTTLDLIVSEVYNEA